MIRGIYKLNPYSTSLRREITDTVIFFAAASPTQHLNSELHQVNIESVQLAMSGLQINPLIIYHLPFSFQ